MSQRKRIWIGVAAGFAVLCCLGIVFGRPAYLKFKEDRALKQAHQFAAKRDYGNAGLSLRVVLRLNPSNAVAAGLLADLLDQQRSPVALTWRRRVAELEPTLTNKLMHAASALRYEAPPYLSTSAVLQNLGAEAETNAAYHLLCVQLALALNHSFQAEKHLRALTRLDPTNRLHWMNLATIQLESKHAGLAATARKDLMALAEDPVLGITALRSLVSESLTRRDFEGALGLADKLTSHPKSTLEDRFLALAVLKSAGAAEFGPKLAALQQTCATNAVSVARAITWMSGQGMAKDALEWSRGLPKTTRETMPVPVAEAECHLTLADFVGLREHVTEGDWGEQDFLRHAFLARALRETGESVHARRYWRRASGAAASERGSLALLLQMARQWGWRDEFKALLWTVADGARGQQWALQALVQEYALGNDTEGLYHVYDALLDRHSGSMEYKNNVAALGLLLGTNMVRSARLAKESYMSSPTNSAVIATYAFALHCGGKTAEGLKLMQCIPEAELRRPDVALYYGVLLAACGQSARAQSYLVAAEKRRALPEEARLLEQARAIPAK